MTITDIKEPIVKILTDHDMRAIKRESERLNLEGWVTVGQQSKFNNMWTQVLVRERAGQAKGRKTDDTIKKITEGQQ